jgi:6-phosphogluconolactonase
VRRLTLVVAAACLVSGLLASGASADPSHFVVGHVYVNDNTEGQNTIAGFARHADGTLTPLPGSPFAAGGAGTGASIGSQGALQTARHGRYLVAVDAGSDQISVLRIEHDGSLQPVGLVASGGNEPVSVTVHHRLVYVANSGDGGANYTGFVFGRHGTLYPLAGSTVSLPDGSSPGDVLFNGDGSKLAGTRVGTSLIDSFGVLRDGRLLAAPQSPFAAQGPGPFGSEFRPTDPNQLFVSNAHGGAGNGTVSAYDVSRDGTLNSIGSSPFADFQTAPCWVEISSDGRFLFTVNTATPSVSSYAIRRDGSLQLIGSTAFKTATAVPALSPFDARLSSDGRTLYVVDSGTAQVSAFRVSGGVLTELGSSPTSLPSGATAFGLVAN